MAIMQKKTIVTILLTLAGAIVLAVAGAIVVAYSGMIDVAAANRPSALTSWFLRTTRDHSVAARARDIQVPALDDPGMLKVGAEHYQEMCVGCHAAPGLQPGEAARGLEPPPPRLNGGLPMSNEEAAEFFWTVKNGIQMTGMPAFGKTHDDQKIWAIVAFLKRMRKMTPEEYRKLVPAPGEHHEDDADAEHKDH